MEQGDYDEAVEAYRLAVSLRPKNVNAYILLANACIKDNEYEDARYFLTLGYENTGSEKIREDLNELIGVMEKRAEQEETAKAEAEAGIENND